MIKDIEDPGCRDFARKAIIEVLADRNPQEALTLLNSIVGDDKILKHLHNDIYLKVFNIWAGNDPLKAIAAAEAVSDSTERQKYLNNVLHIYAQENPDGAMKYMKDNPDVNTEWLRPSLIEQYVVKNPELAKELLNASKDGT